MVHNGGPASNNFAERTVGDKTKSVRIDTVITDASGVPQRADAPFITPCIIDLVIMDPTCATHVAKAAKEDGATAAKGDEAKRKFYATWLQVDDAARQVVPMAVEIFGRTSETTHRFFQWVALRANHDVDPVDGSLHPRMPGYARALHRLYVTLGTALAKSYGVIYRAHYDACAAAAEVGARNAAATNFHANERSPGTPLVTQQDTPATDTQGR